jgi:hypothetical protein
MYNYYVVVWSKGTKVSLDRIVGYTAAQDKNIISLISQYQNQQNNLEMTLEGRLKVGYFEMCFNGSMDEGTLKTPIL